MPRPPVLLPFATILLASCASIPVPATRSPESPAHPAAPEAATPAATPVLRGEVRDPAAEPVTPAEGQGHEGHLMPDTTVAPGSMYTCAMHPQVMSGKPGACPVCGMLLVATQKPKDTP
jgi:hypothetical protein